MNCSAPWTFCNGTMTLSECQLQRCHEQYLSFAGLCGVDICGDTPGACPVCPGPSFFYNLRGTIPDSLCSLENLISFEIGEIPGLTGTVPSCLGDLAPDPKYGYMLSFNLGSMPLTGTIPSGLGSLTMYQGTFALNNLQLSGTLPNSLGSLFPAADFPSTLPNIENMGSFSLYILPLLTGTIPSSLGSLVTLEGSFALQALDLEGTIPSSLGALTDLRTQFVLQDMPRITGRIPSELGALSKLGTSDTKLDGTKLMFAMSRLQLTGTIPAELGAINKVTSIDLGYNELTGPVYLPCQGQTDFYVSMDLKHVDFSNNMLTKIPIEPQYNSSIQSTFCLAPSKVTWLNFSDNALHGAIPSSVGSFTHMFALSINNCGYTGTLPSSLTALSQLEIFSVHGNSLTGPTTSLSAHPLLVDFDVGDNQLSGSLPNDLPYATLTYLDLSSNRFSSAVPQQICTMALQSNETFCNLTQAAAAEPLDCSALNRSCATMLTRYCYGVSSHCVSTSQLFTSEEIAFMAVGFAIFVAIVAAIITLVIRRRRKQADLASKLRHRTGTVELLQQFIPEEDIQSIMLPIDSVDFTETTKCFAAGGGGSVYRCTLTLNATARTEVKKTVALKDIYAMRDDVAILAGKRELAASTGYDLVVRLLCRRLY